jgi:predicted amidohydrolase
MTELKLALAQMRCEKGDWAGNQAAHLRYMAEAEAAGCDLIVFPEASLSGYADYRAFPGAVRPLDSPEVQAFVALTAGYRPAVSAGFVEPNPADPRPFVTQILVQGGQVFGVYRKVHILDEDAPAFSGATAMPVFDLPLAGDPLPCALAICSDSDRPALFAEYARLGARIVFHSAAPGLYGRRTTEAEWWDGFHWYEGDLAGTLGVAAQAHHLPIASVAQAGATADEDFPGGTRVFGPTGQILAALPDYHEGLLITTVVV